MKRVLVRKVLSYINKLVPKMDKITFHSFPDISDNSKAIFDCCINNQVNKSKKIIWLVEEVNESVKFNIENVKVVPRKSLKGMFHFFTSKYVFHTTGLYYNMTPAKGQTIISLWHGMPLKTIGLLDEISREIYKEFDFSYTIATSKFYKKIMKDAFGCEDEEVLVLGQPRNDKLFSDKDIKSKINITNYNKLIIWMPTYRKSTSGQIREEGIKSETGISFLNNNELSLLDDFLNKINNYMIIKIHPMQKLDNSLGSKLKNILIIENDFFRDKDIELYELIGQTDILLTDYSSVYLDYLIKNRPIGFVFNDMKEYKESRGFICKDPMEIMPGKIINSLLDLKIFIDDINNGNDEFRDDRIRINQLINEYNDSSSSERILKFLEII